MRHPTTAHASGSPTQRLHIRACSCQQRGAAGDSGANQPAVTPFVEPRLSSPSFALQNTPASNDLTQDGYSWSQANPIIVDKFDKIILPAQRNNGGSKSNAFIYSNDAGRTWQDNAAFAAEGYIERGTAAYDPENDVIHMLW